MPPWFLPQERARLLYRNLEPDFVATALTDVNGSFEQADRLQPLIEQIQKQPKPLFGPSIGHRTPPTPNPFTPFR